MIRYFVRIPNIAAAETDVAAERLIERGFKECSRRYYMTWWQLNDDARQSEIAKEDALKRQCMSYEERVRRGI